MDHKFEMYKMYVDTAEKVSDRRQFGNGFFISLNTAIIGFKSVANYDFEIYFLDLAINILWYFFIESCQKLSKAKFQVIQKMEDELPYAPFRHEEEVYKKDKRFDFSAIEKCIPIIFGIAYFLAFLRQIIR